jgi:predicted TIM-barrel fold metal-dependent hydrolase
MSDDATDGGDADARPALHWGKSELHGLLPDPEPRPIRYTLISADDHLVEPPGMFTGRLPRHLADAAPRVVETEEGHEVWSFDGQLFWQVGLNAVVGRPREDWLVEPTRFDEMRPGCWDPDARVRDMDLNGVWAAVNFPSQITGFCGRVFAQCSDPELGLAVTRAWNDWLFEEWYGSHPDRFVPLGITYLGDPEQGAEEIRRNAERGFVAVTLPEQPHRIGMKPIFSRWWDPILRACAETGTVVCLHVGSTGVVDMPPGAPMVPLAATLFGQLSLHACAEWLWSPYPLRYPDLQIVMAEGGIGWVGMLHDRLDSIVDRSGYGQYFGSTELRPSDLLRRNFWFCSLDDPSTMSTRHVVGVDRILFEADYPHGDGTWPDSQDVVERYWGSFPADEVAMMTHENAARLFRHPLPPPGSPHAAGLRRG